MACCYHYAEVKAVRTGDIGYARGRGDVHKVHIRAARSQPCGQRTFVHVRAAARILAYDNGAFMLFAIVIAEETPDLVSMIDRKTHIGFSAETVGTEIFGHKLTSIQKTAIKSK